MTHSGAFGSENAGTSNHNAGENPARRKTEVSLALMISQGLAGPKQMAKAACDGHRVNIPWPRAGAMERRRAVPAAHDWMCVSAVRTCRRKIRGAQSERSRNCLVRQARRQGARFPENLLSFNQRESVPQTDTGGLVEKTKANE